jgi:hypothetical protein
MTNDFDGGIHFNGGVNNNQFGANSQMVNYNQQTDPTAARLADQLVTLLAAEAPHLHPLAEAVRSELDPTPTGSAPDTTRIRRWLDLITAGVGAGSGALALAERITHALGG